MTSLVLLSVLFNPPEARADYRARCAGSEVATAAIISTFGEPRDPESEGPMERFHGGVDIAQCIAGSTVESIFAGTISPPSACKSTATASMVCIRVLESNGRAFDYVHLTSITRVAGSTVGVGEFLGYVQTGFTLHLQETLV